MLATGDPKKLLAECDNSTVRNFLTRGEARAPAKQDDAPCLSAPERKPGGNI